MPTKVTMPQLGESVTEGTIGKWLVQPGEHIGQYEPLCEVLTDKVNAEVPSTFAGEVTEIVAEEGETVQVGSLICYIQESGKRESEEEGAASKYDHRGEGDTEQGKDFSLSQPSMKKRYSPAVLKLSQEHDIDLQQVEGTGKGGRITRKDVLQVIKEREMPGKEELSPPVQGNDTVSAQTSVQVPQSNGLQNGQNSSHIPVHRGDQEIPVQGVRRATAQKMVQSKQEIPHAWTMVEVDVSELVKYREKIKADFRQQEGINLTFLPFFIKATVEALKEYPRVNSQWAGDKIIQKKDIHVSVAVAADDELYVPVIHQADEKSVAGLAKSIHDLAHKTRNRQLTQQDTQGGTFTVNNTGSFGSIQSQPIINYPQAAILSVESIVKRPVIKEGMIAIRDMVNLCLSLDHRILDGLTCGRFLQSIKSRLENMGEGTGLY